MQCVDCHNRASHAFESPDRAVDQAMAERPDCRSASLRQEESMELLKASLHERRRSRAKDPSRFEHVLPAEISGRRRQAEPPISKRRGKRWPPSIDATCSRISRSPGAPIRIISATPTIRAASAATTKRTLRRRQKDHHAGLQRLPPTRGDGRSFARYFEDTRINTDKKPIGDDHFAAHFQFRISGLSMPSVYGVVDAFDDLTL